MKVEILFHGLCLFVTDTTVHPARMFVMFPQTPVPPDVPLHTLEISFNGKTESLNHGEELRFRNLPTSGSPATLPDGIANLTDDYQRSVRTDATGNRPPNELRARVLLRDGSLSTGDRDCWNIAGKPESMTNYVEWFVDAPTESVLQWDAWNSAGTASRPLGDVTPDPDGTVRITISHIYPHDNLHDRPQNGYQPHHFRAYHGLLTGGGTGLALPTLQACHGGQPISSRLGDKIRQTSGGHSHHRSHIFSATLYTCMVAGGGV